MKKSILYYCLKSIKHSTSLCCKRYLCCTICLLLSFSLLSCKLESKKEFEEAKIKSEQSVIAKPVVLELITDSGKTIDLKQLSTIISQFKIPGTSIYQWKNHVVIFDTTLNIENISAAINTRLKAIKIKIYDKPFYNFNRTHCDSSNVAKEWDNIILTANLVKDTVLQNEYLNYHKTQFEKWPEVSKGFCNANFQQLLVFKNGRQLMLIISIPKGESLDKLNPKTIKNNTRVNDWNNIMKKYQEGIEGTEKGEVWVFLKQVISGK